LGRRPAIDAAPAKLTSATEAAAMAIIGWILVRAVFSIFFSLENRHRWRLLIKRSGEKTR